MSLLKNKQPADLPLLIFTISYLVGEAECGKGGGIGETRDCLCQSSEHHLEYLLKCSSEVLILLVWGEGQK